MMFASRRLKVYLSERRCWFAGRNNSSAQAKAASLLASRQQFLREGSDFVCRPKAANLSFRKQGFGLQAQNGSLAVTKAGLLFTPPAAVLRGGEAILFAGRSNGVTEAKEGLLHGPENIGIRGLSRLIRIFAAEEKGWRKNRLRKRMAAPFWRGIAAGKPSHDARLLPATHEKAWPPGSGRPCLTGRGAISYSARRTM